MKRFIFALIVVILAVVFCSNTWADAVITHCIIFCTLCVVFLIAWVIVVGIAWSDKYDDDNKLGEWLFEQEDKGLMISLFAFFGVILLEVVTLLLSVTATAILSVVILDTVGVL